MTANNTTPQCPDDPVLRDACVPDGRRLCAHADRDGAGMHWLEAGQTCRSGDDDDDDRGAAAGGAGNRAGSNRPGPLAPNRFGEPPAEAAALLHDGRTAVSLIDQARLRAGEWVLVLGAGGGLGSLVVQLAHGAGARVIGSARGKQKLNLAEELGADAVVDYSQSRWPEQVLADTGGAGADLAFVVDNAVSEGAAGTRFAEIRGQAEGVSVEPPATAGVSPQIIRIHPCRVISWNVDPDHPGLQTRDVAGNPGEPGPIRPSFGTDAGAARRANQAVANFVAELNG